jgi:hypothetical protein
MLPTSGSISVAMGSGAQNATWSPPSQGDSTNIARGRQSLRRREMRHVAHGCVTFRAGNDAKASPMRHRFGPKRRRNPDDGQKPRFYRCLSETRPGTEVTHGVHFAPGPCRIRRAIVEAAPAPLRNPSMTRRTSRRCRLPHGRSLPLEPSPAHASSTITSHGRDSIAWRASAAALCLARTALFHHPRSCRAKVNETLTRALLIGSEDVAGT